MGVYRTASAPVTSPFPRWGLEVKGVGGVKNQGKQRKKRKSKAPIKAKQRKQ